MKIMPSTTEKRNQRITARLRRIQGQIAAIERSLVEIPMAPSFFKEWRPPAER